MAMLSAGGRINLCGLLIAFSKQTNKKTSFYFIYLFFNFNFFNVSSVPTVGLEITIKIKIKNCQLYQWSQSGAPIDIFQNVKFARPLNHPSKTSRP